MAVVLVVDDERAVREVMRHALSAAGHRPVTCDGADAAMETARRVEPDLAIIDLRLGGSMDGLSLFKALKGAQPKLLGMMVTGYASYTSALQCGQAGIDAYMDKPFHREQLLAKVDELLQKLSPAHLADHATVGAEVPCFDGMVGASPPMRGLFNRIIRVAPLDEPVLIQGETGTGKELVARSIHKRSRRASGPFVAVNCAAIPGGLFETEFFGHERGAFTDAREARPGRFEQAHGGTLFLDEIADLSLEAQAKVLRALDNREVTRIGGRRTIPVDVRILAATNADLSSNVEAGRFRRDLYWRLDAISIPVAPLRERGEDVALLVHHLVRDLSRRLQEAVPRFSDAALADMNARTWRGNIRELEHVIWAALLSAKGSIIDVQDLPTAPEQMGDIGEAVRTLSSGRPLRETVGEVRSQVERFMIERALRNHDTVAAAASALGIDPKTLYEKRTRYRL